MPSSTNQYDLTLTIPTTYRLRQEFGPKSSELAIGYGSTGQISCLVQYENRQPLDLTGIWSIGLWAGSSWADGATVYYKKYQGFNDYKIHPDLTVSGLFTIDSATGGQFTFDPTVFTPSLSQAKNKFISVEFIFQYETVIQKSWLQLKLASAGDQWA